MVQAGWTASGARREIDPGSRRRVAGELTQALALLEQAPAATEWFGAELLSGYLLFKRAECQALESWRRVRFAAAMPKSIDVAAGILNAHECTVTRPR